MPIIGFLWDYSSPAIPFAAGASFDPDRIVAMSLLLASSTTQLARVDSPAAYAGDLQAMFGGDFYDRFHFSAVSFDLGSLVGDQQRALTAWNAYRRARVLESLALVDAEGISIEGQPPAPLQFAPQQERTYQITVGTDGPPVIEAAIVFDFDEGQSVTISLTGSRVTAWTWMPNWADGLMERLEWLTDVIQAYRGEEQARALRLNPRHILEFSVMVEGPARRHLEAALWNWGARVWALPLWHDGVDLHAPLSAGASSVPIVPTLRDFRGGTLALIMGETPRDYEVVEVDAANPAELVLARPTARAWPTGTRIYPARTARVEGDAALARFTGRASSLRLRFEMVEPAEWTADAGATTYRGYPVLTTRPDWSEEPTLTLERKLAVLDSQVGPASYDDEADMPLTEQRMRWLLDGRAEIDAHRKLLFALRGKQRRIWVPTWTEDFVVIAPVGSADLALDIEWCGFSLYYQAGVNRRDIRIETVTGQVYYRRITSSAELDPSTERLSIDAALGADLQPDDFLLVSFIALSRQASDAVEFDWFTGEAARSASTMRTIRHDV